jgi:hypothetical protein
LRTKEIIQQADATHTDRVIALTGNHELEFLAKPNKIEKEVVKSVRARQSEIKGLPKDEKIKAEAVYKSEMGEWIRSLPLGALVGDRLFIHSGFMDEKIKEEDSDADVLKKVESHVQAVASAYQSGDYKKIGDSQSSYSSLFSFHDWIQHPKKRLKMVRAYQLVGVRGIVMGHEPGALKARGTTAISEDGWVLKVDAGMGEEADSEGRLVKCETKRILFEKPNHIAFLKDGHSLCHQVDPFGKRSDYDPSKDEFVPIVKYPKG